MQCHAHIADNYIPQNTRWNFPSVTQYSTLHVLGKRRVKVFQVHSAILQPSTYTTQDVIGTYYFVRTLERKHRLHDSQLPSAPKEVS